jgi:hypothetical protein
MKLATELGQLISPRNYVTQCSQVILQRKGCAVHVTKSVHNCEAAALLLS